MVKHYILYCGAQEHNIEVNYQKSHLVEACYVWRFKIYNLWIHETYRQRQFLLNNNIFTCKYCEFRTPKTFIQDISFSSESWSNKYWKQCRDLHLDANPILMQVIKTIVGYRFELHLLFLKVSLMDETQHRLYIYSRDRIHWWCIINKEIFIIQIIQK